jgi:hypothetical protein
MKFWRKLTEKGLELKVKNRLNEALLELANTLSKNVGGYEQELYNIINSWAKNHIEVYSIKSEITNEVLERTGGKDYKKYMEEHAFIKIAHELGKTCGVTQNKGHQYRPEWILSKTRPYIEEFETSIYCLRRYPRN